MRDQSRTAWHPKRGAAAARRALRALAITAATATGILAASACGNPNANVSANLGWTFDYRDWTDQSLTAAPSDPRGCDNTAPLGTDEGVPYPRIERVRVFAFDPSGKSPSLHEVFECPWGADGNKVQIRGLGPRVYHLVVDGLAADGTVLYRHEDTNFDASAGVINAVLPLRAATGELRFFPRFDDVSFPDCPSDVELIRYSLTRTGDNQTQSIGDLIDENGEVDVEIDINIGGPDASGSESVNSKPEVMATRPVCQDGATDRLIIRNIPTRPQQGLDGSYETTDYELLLEGLTPSGATLYNKRTIRPVRPGNNSLGGDEVLQRRGPSGGDTIG